MSHRSSLSASRAGPSTGERPDPPCDGADCRCECGSLLARVVESGIELKCRRCKRVLLVPVAVQGGVAAHGTPLRVVAAGHAG